MEAKPRPVCRGTGKTRLALRLAETIAGSGWRTQWVRPRDQDGAVAAAREAGQPALLVVDYADIRVLLLARSGGEWWQQLTTGSDSQAGDLLAAARPVVLGPVSGGFGQAEVFAAALTAFARRLGSPARQLR